MIFLKENGVNRLSIGVESFNKYKLKYLNRKHNKKDIFSKIALARKVGFDNINIDIIYALPIEDMSILKSDIKYALKLKVDHISTYSLIIEEHTLLHNKGVKPISEDCPMFDLELLYVVKPRGGEARLEFKNAGYGMSMENAIKKIAHYRVCSNHKDEAIRIKTYIFTP